MKRGMWVSDITANRPVEGVFLAKEKRLLKGKTGKPYLLLQIMDRTGEAEARIWDRVEELGGRFQSGDLIRISGEAVSYQGKVQVKIKEIWERLDLEEGDRPLFIPGYLESLKRSEQRLEELLSLAEGIDRDDLKGLVTGFLTDPGLREGWLTAPAAKRLHHARLGGLLEHTLSVCKLVEEICGHYPQLQRDLLLAGAVLHDVGKLRELDSPWRPEYTKVGRLLGHVVMGVEMLHDRLASGYPLPEEDALALKHLILSHHGQLEYGSPKRPKTLEALVLHILDDLDAKFDAFYTHLSEAAGDGEEWTSYHPLLERYLYRGPSFLEGEEAVEG